MGTVLVLTGSARKRGNSSQMADAFARGAESAGHNVTRFDTAFKKIGGCKACRACFSRGQACVFQDDFNELAEIMKVADAIAFASPMYWFSFPATLKTAIDKFNAFHVASIKPSISQSVLMVCGADQEKHWYDAISWTYKLMVQYQGWHDHGSLIVPNVNHVGDIEKTNALENAEKMGQSLYIK